MVPICREPAVRARLRRTALTTRKRSSLLGADCPSIAVQSAQRRLPLVSGTAEGDDHDYAIPICSAHRREARSGWRPQGRRNRDRFVRVHGVRVIHALPWRPDPVPRCDDIPNDAIPSDAGHQPAGGLDLGSAAAGDLVQRDARRAGQGRAVSRKRDRAARDRVRLGLGRQSSVDRAVPHRSAHQCGHRSDRTGPGHLRAYVVRRRPGLDRLLRRRNEDDGGRPEHQPARRESGCD